MTQVKDMTDQQLNIVLSELMGYTVDKRNTVTMAEFSITST